MTSSRVSFPLLLVNLKTYKESTGEKAVRLASLAEKASRRRGSAWRSPPRPSTSAP